VILAIEFALVVVTVEWVVVSSWSSLSPFEASRAPGSFGECIGVRRGSEDNKCLRYCGDRVWGNHFLTRIEQ
jgi:hypothetical protein